MQVLEHGAHVRDAGPNNTARRDYLYLAPRLFAIYGRVCGI
jgi:hypothetical protein